MMTAVKINGQTLVSIKEAAASVSYSRDYVARLAREGKIVASQIGRQWFVDPVSLKSFSEAASSFEEVRKIELRAERKRELMAKESLLALDAIAKEKMHRQRFDALTMTFAVVCLGLITGAGVYATSLFPNTNFANLAFFSSEMPQTTSTSKTAAVAATEGSPFRPVGAPKDTLLLTTVVERPVFTAESETLSLGEKAEGILVLARDAKINGAADVANLFSDEVKVTFTDEVSGVISYDQGEGVVAEYPFVAVPTIKEGEVIVTTE